MKHRGAFTVFAAAFAVVLLGGLALAQVGALRPTTAPELDEVTLVSAISADAASDTASESGSTDAGRDNNGKVDGTTEDPAPGDGKVDDGEPGDKPDDGEGYGEEGPGDGEKGDGGEEGGGDDDDDDPEDTTPPRIEILHPEDGQVFHEKTITFEGKTEPGAKVTAGRYEADVDREGNWHIRLVLTEGRNLARFTATDAAGNSSEATVTVVYEPEREDPPKTEFSAHQKYGSSAANPPYDVFHGTAKPGAGIVVESEYGSGRTEADAEGHWEIKVTFPEAPVGKGFKVVVESTDGGRAVFEFVHKGDKTEHEFTANQKYGSCGEDVPYDVFWGRADAGERIWVESPYGSGVTEAGPEGHWEIKVEFPEAPKGKVFEVVVEAENGGRKVFTFVNTGGSDH